MKKQLVVLALSALVAVSCLGVPAFADEGAAAAETEQTTSVVTAEAEQPAVPETTPPATEQPSIDTVAAAPAHTFTYVALGDSITAGNGLPDFQYAPAAIGVDASPNFEGYSPDCFVAKVADSLGLDRQHAINLGLPALMSQDMIDLLSDGAMPHMNQPSGTYYVYPQYQDYVREADVITLQIGSNDALVPFVVSIGNATNWKSEEFANSLVSGAFRYMNSESFALLSDSLSRLKLTKEERAALNYVIGDGMRANCEEAYTTVSTNLPLIIDAIRELNPDVDIILLGCYNPAWMLAPWRNYFSKLNSFEKQLAKDEGLTYISLTWTSTSNDMHPSRRGHEDIGKKIVNAIQKQPNYLSYQN